MMAKRRGGADRERVFNIVSIVFLVLSIIWIIFVLIRLLGG